MRGGIWVLNVTAAMWVASGLLLTGATWWWLALPVAISIALLGWANQRVRGAAASGGDHVGRVVGIWSALEGVAIFFTANALINAHRADLLMPAIAVIVGLHFFGLAKDIPVRLYWVTGAALVVAGAAALIAPPWHLPLAMGVTAAVILWLSGIALARGAR